MRKNLIYLVCLMVTFCVLVPSGALADSTGWSPAVAVDDGSYDAEMPSVAMNGLGDAIVAWVRWDGASANVFTRQFTDGAWGAASMLDQMSGSTGLIQVALNDKGVGMAVWRQSTGASTASICASFYHNGAWELPVKIDNELGYATKPQLALDDEGDAFVAWIQVDISEENVYANRYSSGTWGSAVLLDNMNGNPSDVRVAMSNGEAVVTWEQHDGAYRSAYASHFTGSWTIQTALETADGDVYSLCIAMGDDGSAIAVWDQTYVTGYHLFTNRYSSGEWGERTLIEDMDLSAIDPQIAMTGSEATVVWMQGDASFVDSIYAVRFVSGEWGDATLLDSMSEEARYPQIAASGEGSAIAIWTQGLNIMASRYDDGLWDAPSIVRGMESAIVPAYIGSVEPIDIAVNRHGDTIAVWQESTNSKSPFSLLASLSMTDDDDPGTADSESDFGTIGLIISCIALAIALVAVILVLRKDRGRL